MLRVLASLLAAGTLATATAAAPVRSIPAPNPAPAAKAIKTKKAHQQQPYQVGKASWYGKKFDGRSTASGETYDMFQFTAAHPTLPLGTVVRVTNLRNGQSVVVRINDRGPVITGRIIDLSYGAAQVLQLMERGVGKVRLDFVTPDQMTVARTFASALP